MSEPPPEDPPPGPETTGPLEVVSFTLTSSTNMGIQNWVADLVLTDAEGASYAVQLPMNSVTVTPPEDPPEDP